MPVHWKSVSAGIALAVAVASAQIYYGILTVDDGTEVNDASMAFYLVFAVPLTLVWMVVCAAVYLTSTLYFKPSGWIGKSVFAFGSYAAVCLAITVLGMVLSVGSREIGEVAVAGKDFFIYISKYMLASSIVLYCFVILSVRY